MRLRAPPLLVLVLAYLAFVSLGLPDAVLGVVWPSLSRTFELPRAALGAPLAASAVTYFSSGFFAGRLMQHLGVGKLLAASTGLVAVGVTGYAVSPVFGVFLASAAIVGFGSGAVDAGLNTYAATHFGPRHMNWLHAAYSVGAALGPAIMTALIARDAEWRIGYALIASLLFMLAIAFTLTTSRWSDHGPPSSAEPSIAASRPEPPTHALHALRDRRVLVSALLFFLYTGVEVGAGQWSYTILTEARGLTPELAGLAVTGYWAALLAGRILSGFIVERLGNIRLVRLGTLLAIAAALVFAVPFLPVSVAALALSVLGFAIAPIFPGLMSETPRRVGKRLSAHSVGLQVSAATTGVAVLPNIGGILSSAIGLSAVAAFIAITSVALCLTHELLIHLADRNIDVIAV